MFIISLRLFSDMAHFIPIETLVLPPRNRQIREVDDSFLKQLIRNMEEQPSGNYEALFVAVKGLQNKEEFNIDKIDENEYEVLGGTHVTLATKQLHEKFPENPNYRGRVARIYIGLKDDEALWLGAMHNHTGSFRHQLTYSDEVITTNSTVLTISSNCLFWQKLKILIVLVSSCFLVLLFAERYIWNKYNSHEELTGSE